MPPSRRSSRRAPARCSSVSAASFDQFQLTLGTSHHERCQAAQRWQRSRRRITKAATSPHRATSDSPRSATSPTPHAGGAGPSLERGGVCSTHPRSIRLRRARALEQVGHLATQKSPTKSGLLNANPSRTSGRSPLLLRWRAFALRPHPGLLRTGFDLAREPPMRVHLFAPRESEQVVQLLPLF
jgi:hypothetical protein